MTIHYNWNIQKTVKGVIGNYVLCGKNIILIARGSAALHFWYDAQNRPAIVQFNNTKYAYIHSLQGDIVGILDSTGPEVVKYAYDAWGKVLSTTGSLAATLGTVQPFRYRGYVYDVETGLYYLRSRYYNPEWGRFINADTRITLQKSNVFVYCINNPICLFDNDGTIPSFVLRVLVHNAVCLDIAASVPGMIYGIGMKVEYNMPINEKTYGFYDLVNTYTLEAYEVKRVNLSHKDAINQLMNYIKEGIWKGFLSYFPEKSKEDIPKLHPGTNSLIKGTFVLFGHYKVDYWFDGDGIIAYDYNDLDLPDLVPQQQEHTKKQKNSASFSSVYGMAGISNSINTGLVMVGIGLAGGAIIHGGNNNSFVVSMLH